jgi:hypothetical protein
MIRPLGEGVNLRVAPRGRGSVPRATSQVPQGAADGDEGGCGGPASHPAHRPPLPNDDRPHANVSRPPSGPDAVQEDALDKGNTCSRPGPVTHLAVA